MKKHRFTLIELDCDHRNSRVDAAAGFEQGARSCQDDALHEFHENARSIQHLLLQ